MMIRKIDESGKKSELMNYCLYECETKPCFNSDTIDKVVLPPEEGWIQSVKGTTSPIPIRVKSKIKHVRESPYKRYFLSEKWSDIHFHCPDGTILHAHKVILSTNSSYFRTVFEGLWDKEHPNGIWKTTNPPDIMKVILSFIYKSDLIDIQSTGEDLFSTK